MMANMLDGMYVKNAKQQENRKPDTKKENRKPDTKKANRTGYQEGEIVSYRRRNIEQYNTKDTAPKEGDTASYRRRHGAMNTKVWRRDSANTDTWGGDTGSHGRRYAGYNRTSEEKERYRRTVRNRTANGNARKNKKWYSRNRTKEKYKKDQNEEKKKNDKIK